jgi:hypothetical protein
VANRSIVETERRRAIATPWRSVADVFGGHAAESPEFAMSGHPDQLQDKPALVPFSTERPIAL